MAVFNFRVSGAHTYLVREQDVDGDVDALPAWVHNASYKKVLT